MFYGLTKTVPVVFDPFRLFTVSDLLDSSTLLIYVTP